MRMNKSKLVNFTLCFLLSTFFCKAIAQNQAALTPEEITKLVNPDEKKWRNIFISFGGEFVENFNINNSLINQEIAVLPTNLFYVGIGLSYRNQDYLNTFEAELGFNFANNEADNLDIGSAYNEFQLQLRYERKFAEIESAFFSAGLQAKGMFAGLDIFLKDALVNIDNLNNASNNASLQHQALFLGPSVSFKWVNPNTERLVLQVMMNYDFNLYANKWKSNYGKVLNSFKEDATRFSIKMLIPLYF